MNADGSDVHHLTDPSLWSDIPSWLPDGTKILFLSETAAPAPNTYG